MSGLLLAVYGASGCGRGIMPLARTEAERRGIPLDRLVFIDDAKPADNINGHRVLTYAEFCKTPASERFVALAIANGGIREEIAARLANDGLQPWSLTADNAVIMDDVSVGPGALISPFVTLTSNITIGDFFHANLYSYVEHDCRIGDFVTFAPSVKCNGNIVIEDHAYIGAGAVIRQGKPGAPIVIGRGAIVGMGAVVTRSVAPGVTVAGNPARQLTEKG